MAELMKEIVITAGQRIEAIKALEADAYTKNLLDNFIGNGLIDAEV
jgi:hypothetical protein